LDATQLSTFAAATVDDATATVSVTSTLSASAHLGPGEGLAQAVERRTRVVLLDAAKLAFGALAAFEQLAAAVGDVAAICTQLLAGGGLALAIIVCQDGFIRQTVAGIREVVVAFIVFVASHRGLTAASRAPGNDGQRDDKRSFHHSFQAPHSPLHDDSQSVPQLSCAV
jgi:hypothetical protein